MTNKIKLIFIMLVLISSAIKAQLSNSVKVSEVVSPIANFNYSEGDSIDLIIRIRNSGPNDLIPADQFLITYSIATNDSSFSADTSLRVGADMLVNDIFEYTLLKDIHFNNSNFFIACADVKGTSVFPDNTNKFPSDCSSFIVGLEKIHAKNQDQPALSKVYFASGTLFFQYAHKANIQAMVLDLNGRKLIEQSLSPQVNSIDFSPPAKGIYFLWVIDSDGNKASRKFIVN